MTVFHAILGLLLLLGVFIGAVVVLARTIATESNHDLERCDCADCKNRRIRRFKKRWTAQEKRDREQREKRERKRGQWLCTLELSEGRRVVSQQNTPFEITAIAHTDQAWIVHLRNLRTLGVSQVRVLKPDLQRPMWKPWGGR